MLDGWYCRSMASATVEAEEQERAQEESKLKKEYRFLKRKFKHLIYVRLLTNHPCNFFLNRNYPRKTKLSKKH